MSTETITSIQERDYSKSSNGFLGKLPRSLSAVRRNFFNQAQELGATEAQAKQQWLDAKDVAELEFYAED